MATGAFRPEIEGLRAVSIVLVLAHHFAPTWAPGGYLGVDVFFVISGYLITTSLLAHQGAGRTLLDSLLDFWSRRARRLLPNALLVLVVATLVGAWALPDPAASRLGADVSWAAGYAINWLYVLRSVDYLRSGETAHSALLNYWSLAVEEQFYLVWPIVLLLVLGRGRAWRWALALGSLSILGAIWIGQSRLALAFFSSPLRAWELLLGAALALAPLRQGSAATAWLGALSVVLAVATMTPDSHHPGIVTLLPVFGSVALIAGMAQAPLSALTRAMGCAPMRWVGARSYSLYLWHWPVLVLGSALWASTHWVKGLVLLALALLLSETAYRWVESPARWRWGRSAPARRVLLLALVGSLAVALLGHGLRFAAERGLRATHFAQSGRVGRLPPLQDTKSDLPVVYANRCHLGLEPGPPPSHCLLGHAAGERAAVLFGDSHAAQWVPALLPVASERGLALAAWTRSSCPSADVTVWLPASRGVYRACDDWREAVFRALEAIKPEVIFIANFDDDAIVLVDRTSGQLVRGAAAQAAFEVGLVRTLRRLRAMGHRVVVIRDTPRPRQDVIECVYAGGDSQRCELSLTEATSNARADSTAAAAAGVSLWDLDGQICPGRRCPVVDPQTGRLVYRDDNHLSASFAATLAPALAARWRRLVEPGR
ncbi:MAG: hypothetical protein LKCHEGNO_01747 [Burkholderiaceae bacterium]|nr:hypothetical protein [Burkholderiaceae bacterium]